MMPRARMWSFPSGALVALALGAAPADAQTPVARRDSGRVYRVQVQRSGDTVYVRNLRVTRQQLQERLDSLQHEFEGLGLEVHGILSHVPLHDVTAVDLPGGGAGRTLAGWVRRWHRYHPLPEELGVRLAPHPAQAANRSFQGSDCTP